jgi:hypothetical protein
MPGRPCGSYCSEPAFIGANASLIIYFTPFSPLLALVLFLLRSLEGFSTPYTVFYTGMTLNSDVPIITFYRTTNAMCRRCTFQLKVSGASSVLFYSFLFYLYPSPDYSRLPTSQPSSLPPAFYFRGADLSLTVSSINPSSIQHEVCLLVYYCEPRLCLIQD